MSFLGLLCPDFRHLKFYDFNKRLIVCTILNPVETEDLCFASQQFNCLILRHSLQGLLECQVSFLYHIQQYAYYEHLEYCQYTVGLGIMDGDNILNDMIVFSVYCNYTATIFNALRLVN